MVPTLPMVEPGTRDAAPLYRLVESHLRALINSGKLVSGDLIPSETELAALAETAGSEVLDVAARSLPHSRMKLRSGRLTWSSVTSTPRVRTDCGWRT